MCDFDFYGSVDNTVSLIFDGSSQVWVQPTEAYLTLTKEEFHNIQGEATTQYQISQSTHYQGNVTPGHIIHYRIFIGYKSLVVLNYVVYSPVCCNVKETIFFNGWKAFGEIGGVIFLLVVIQRLLMFVVGFCLENNSKVLNGKNSDSGTYSPL